MTFKTPTSRLSTIAWAIAENRNRSTQKAEEEIDVEVSKFGGLQNAFAANSILYARQASVAKSNEKHVFTSAMADEIDAITRLEEVYMRRMFCPDRVALVSIQLFGTIKQHSDYSEEAIHHVVSNFLQSGHVIEIGPERFALSKAGIAEIDRYSDLCDIPEGLLTKTYANGDGLIMELHRRECVRMEDRIKSEGNDWLRAEYACESPPVSLIRIETSYPHGNRRIIALLQLN